MAGRWRCWAVSRKSFRLAYLSYPFTPHSGDFQLLLDLLHSGNANSDAGWRVGRPAASDVELAVNPSDGHRLQRCCSTRRHRPAGDEPLLRKSWGFRPATAIAHFSVSGQNQL